MVRNWRNARGFTLVELLIVVAIIGVLATVGIPTFQRMLQKSRKGEAKVNLGNLFTSEAAFFSEYGAYGNNLREMGYEVAGNFSQMRYRIGFHGAAADWSAPASVLPSNAIGIPYYNAVKLNHPNWDTAGTYTPTGWTGAAVPVMNGFGRCSLTVSTVAAGADVATTFDAFTAEAAGVIRGGINLDTGVGGALGPASNLDGWTLTQTRTLTNVQDGM